jgi:Holliday junction resolvasome RuvABC endonuclease subunit
MARVLGIDPGFAFMGYAVLDVSQMVVLDIGVLRTEKSHRKRGVLCADDDSRRVGELYRGVEAIVARHAPMALCMEARTSPRHASTSAQLAASVAIVVCVAERHGLPVLHAPPKLVKGAAGVPKREVLPKHLRRPALDKVGDPAKHRALRQEADRMRREHREQSKSAVRAAMLAAYPRSRLLRNFAAAGSLERQSHGFDALAVIHACLHSDVIRTIRQVTKRKEDACQ